MLKPNLTDFTDFIEKPKPVKIKTKYEIQKDINLYMNLALFLIIVVGVVILYLRGKTKDERQQQATQKIAEFDDYMKDYMEEEIIHSMLDQQNYNVHTNIR